MKKWVLFLSVVFVKNIGFSLASPPFIPQDYLNKEIYLKNETFLQKIYVKKQEQYQLIKKVLDQYKRPFTVLDLSETDSYFTLRILQDFPDSVSIFVERSVSIWNKKGHPLTEYIKKFPFHAPKNCIIVQKNITFADIERLSASDHFDVILAMQYPSRLDFTKQEEGEHIIKTFLHMGDDVFFELSWDQEILKTTLENHSALEQSESWDEQTLYHAYQNNPSQLRKHYFRNSGIDSICHSCRENSFLEKLGVSSESHFEKPLGISLVTFKALRGTYPCLSFLEKELARIEKNNDRMFFPHQVYIQGSKVTYMDIPYIPPYRYQEDLSLKNFAKQTLPADMKNFLKIVYAITEE